MSSRCSRPVEYFARPASWSAKPIVRRTAAGSRATSYPATVAVPDVGDSSVPSMRIVVVLPAPLGPSSPKTSPSAISNETPRTASTPPGNVLRKSRHSSIGTRGRVTSGLTRRGRYGACAEASISEARRSRRLSWTAARRCSASTACRRPRTPAPRGSSGRSPRRSRPRPTRPASSRPRSTASASGRRARSMPRPAPSRTPATSSRTGRRRCRSARASRSEVGAAVHLGHDVRVGTMAEFRLGAGKPYRSILGVFWGTGVGGGLILNGRAWTGRRAAGEIGHMVIKRGGARCPCGRVRLHGGLRGPAGDGARGPPPAQGRPQDQALRHHARPRPHAAHERGLGARTRPRRRAWRRS